MQEIPKLGFGTFRLSGRKGKSAVKSAIYAGYKHIDTAHMYKNESLVGEAIAECISEGVITREEIFIQNRTSKLHSNFHDPDLIIAVIKHQLNLLKLNYLDLYLIHAPWGTVSTDNASFSVDNIYENGFPVIKDFDHMLIWRELEKAVDQGLVRRIGLSNFDELQVDKINSVFN